MELNCNALTTTATLNLDKNATEDDKIRFINLASQIIASETGRILIESSHEESCMCLGSQTMILNNYPIIAVTTITYRGTDVEVDPDGFDIDYENGIIRNLDGIFLGNMTVKYSAGYVVDDTGKTIPADLEESCIQLAKALYYNEPSFNTENTKEYPPFVERVIMKYKDRAMK